MAPRVRIAPPGYFAERARQKQAAREADERALAEGRITQEELRRKNGFFAFPNAKINLKKAKLS